MNNIILGNGLSGIIIASVLNYKGEKFKIYAKGDYIPKNIALLKYDSNEELELLSKIFKIKNIKKYTKHIKVGYRIGNITTNIPQPFMIDDYLKKQNRTSASSSMSDGVNEYDAILLNEIYPILYKRYSKKVKHVLIGKEVLDNLLKLENINIYNTIFDTKCNDNKPELECVVEEKNDTGDYDYIYDCSSDNNIKRYTPTTIEYCNDYNVYKYKTIKNYYDEPKIYKTNYAKNNINWYDISRNATKTQLKQKDIIYYLINELGINNE